MAKSSKDIQLVELKDMITQLNTTICLWGKDTYSADQKWSIMYGYSSRTATGVTSDANAFLNQKY